MRGDGAGRVISGRIEPIGDERDEPMVDSSTEPMVDGASQWWEIMPIEWLAIVPGQWLTIVPSQWLAIVPSQWRWCRAVSCGWKPCPMAMVLEWLRGFVCSPSVSWKSGPARASAFGRPRRGVGRCRGVCLMFFFFCKTR
ncbi:unnamed protein product [Laminaria digitata]